MNFSIMRTTASKMEMMVFLLTILLLSGCSTSRVAPDLLAATEKLDKPLVDNAAAISVDINPEINNYEKIDEALKESLEIALTNANLFGSNSSQTYKIVGNILVASQATFSFGSFEGKLEVHYQMFDESNVKILDEKIYTEAGSDKKYFAGAKRHARSRAVNISKNVLEFVELAKARLVQN